MVVTSPVLVCCIEPNDTLLWCREVEVRLVAEAGLSFAVVDNAAFRSFAQLLIQIGSKHGNIDVDEVLYGRRAIRDAVFAQMKECQKEIQKQVAISYQHKAVSFCTDMTTDDGAVH